MSQWISVKDKLPELRIRVLVFDTNKFQSIAFTSIFMEETYWDSDGCGCDISEITHWMPLPSSPKEIK